MRSAPLAPRLLAALTPLPLLIGAALLGGACSDATDGDPLSASFPLFKNLDEAAFDASCQAFRVEQAKAEGKLFTSAPKEIHWAKDIYAGIERAKQEDKPIFLQTHCRQNADTACDV